MWACHRGLEKVVRCFLLQGANVHAKDSAGWTAAHYAALSNEPTLFDALREADANFDIADHNGDTPLHVAVENRCLDFCRTLLEGLVYASPQNFQGNQPCHIAARDNNIDCLKLISLYDEHIGRVNYSHLTPLGIAKFHNATLTRQFLERYYVLLESATERNEDGEIWWDKRVEDKLKEWTVIPSADGSKMYRSKLTGVLSATPPILPSREIQELAQFNQLPYRRIVELVKEKNTITKHEYKLEHSGRNESTFEQTKTQLFFFLHSNPLLAHY